MLLQAARCNESPAGQSALRQFLVRLCDFGSALINKHGPGGVATGVSPRGSTPYSCPQICVGLVMQGTIRHALSKVHALDASALRREYQAGYDAFAADVWSFGITLFTLIYGREPFRAAFVHSSTFRAFVRATQPHVLGDAIMCPASEAFWASSTAQQHTPPLLQSSCHTTHTHLAHQAAAVSWAWPECFSPALTHLLAGCLRVRQRERLTMEQVVTHPWFKNPHWVPPSAKMESSFVGTCSSTVSSGLCGESDLDGRAVLPMSAFASAAAGQAELAFPTEFHTGSAHFTENTASQTSANTHLNEPHVLSGAVLQPIVRCGAPSELPMPAACPVRLESASLSRACSSADTGATNPCTCGAAAAAVSSDGRWSSALSTSAGMPSLDTAASAGGGDTTWAHRLQPTAPAEQKPHSVSPKKHRALLQPSTGHTSLVCGEGIEVCMKQPAGETPSASCAVEL